MSVDVLELGLEGDEAKRLGAIKDPNERKRETFKAVNAAKVRENKFKEDIFAGLKKRKLKKGERRERYVKFCVHTLIHQV